MIYSLTCCCMHCTPQAMCSSVWGLHVCHLPFSPMMSHFSCAVFLFRNTRISPGEIYWVRQVQSVANLVCFTGSSQRRVMNHMLDKLTTWDQNRSQVNRCKRDQRTSRQKIWSGRMGLGTNKKQPRLIQPIKDWLGLIERIKSKNLFQQNNGACLFYSVVLYKAVKQRPLTKTTEFSGVEHHIICAKSRLWGCIMKKRTICSNLC